MRTLVVIVAISMILASLSIVEAATIKKFCDEMENSVSVAMKNIDSDTINKKDIDRIEKVWKKYKTIVFVFVNHNLFKDYECCISEMAYHYNFGEKENLYFKSYNLSEINKRMKESMQFNIGNIF